MSYGGATEGAKVYVGNLGAFLYTLVIHLQRYTISYHHTASTNAQLPYVRAKIFDTEQQLSDAFNVPQWQLELPYASKVRPVQYGLPQLTPRLPLHVSLAYRV